MYVCLCMNQRTLDMCMTSHLSWYVLRGGRRARGVVRRAVRAEGRRRQRYGGVRRSGKMGVGVQVI